MFYIGCHLSAAKGYLSMGKAATEIGANTFQFFTRNPRGGKAKELDREDIKQYLSYAKENGFGKIIAHAPYTVNLCSQDERTRAFADMVMRDDLERMEHIPGNYYNFHPGSHVGQGVEVGIDLIATMLNDLLWENQTTTVLLETMAGKGSEIGSNFQELRSIIDKIELHEKIGVCMDTCHLSDAGYDIIHDLEGVLEEFDRIVGISRLKAMHINDSMNSMGARKDRHAKLGEGQIGLAAIEKIVCHPKLRDLPFVLETPNDLDGYENEIATLRKVRAD